MIPNENEYNLASNWDELIIKIEGERSLCDSRFYADLIYANALILVEDKPINPRQISKIVQFLGEEIISQTRFQEVLRENFSPEVEQFSPLELKENELETAIFEWKTLQTIHIISPEEYDRILLEFSNRLSSVDNSKIIAELSISLLSGDRINNPKIRNLLVQLWSESILALNGTDDEAIEAIRNLMVKGAIKLDELKDELLEQSELRRSVEWFQQNPLDVSAKTELD